MAKQSLARMLVVTADQVHSRKVGDRVPEALDALAGVRRISKNDNAIRPFARTAGDEIQALLADPTEVVAVVETLSRLGGWRVGIGIGEVETPVPDDVRAATGTAFYAAREALAEAHHSPQGLALVDGDSDVGDSAFAAQTALRLLRALWRRRTAAGWQVVDELSEGRSGRQVAERLGITPSAVSQRAAAANAEELADGTVLTAQLLAAAMTSPGESVVGTGG